MSQPDQTSGMTGAGGPEPRVGEATNSRPAPTDTGAPQDTKDQAAQVAAAGGDRAKDVARSARQEAEEVRRTARAEGTEVADTVQQEAGNVAHEAGRQGRRLLDEGVVELQTQAGHGQQRLAELARSYGSELQSMTTHSDQSGPVTDLASNAQRILDDAAHWLERNEPSDVLDSVRRFASRNPWQFLAISAGVGFLGARVVRGLQKSEGAERSQRPAEDVSGRGTPVAGEPQEAPAWGGGPRRDADGYVRPSGTPGVGVPPSAVGGVGDTPVASTPDDTRRH